MTKAIEKITIVGGGTSGWLAALYLATHFAEAISRGAMRIELIESANVAIIGVGESLSPSMPVTLKELGVSESHFIKATDATFKLAGYFVDWDNGGSRAKSSWVNPFVGYLTAGYEFERFEVSADQDGISSDYARTVSPCRDAIEQRKAPRKVGDKEYSSILRYAYHTDATKFAPFMKELAVKRGVVHIVDHVENVTLDHRGFVASLQLQEHGELPVEMVIDASGFRSVILNQALGVSLVDYSAHLLNDRAVVAQLPSQETDDIEPATRATALEEGWAFRVPLYSRTGNGYIFSSKYTDDEKAVETFSKYLEIKSNQAAFRFIPMRVGRPTQTWKNNCIALGLAAGFVEPLEASAIYSVETSLKWLVHYFPTAEFPEALANRYNERTAGLYDEVVEYIVMHYRLSHRDDSDYWRAQKNEIALPDRLKQNLEIWRHALPVRGDVAPTNYFDHNTYIAALFGKAFYRGASLKPERHLQEKEWAERKNMIQTTHDRALVSLPGHKHLLESIRSQ